MRKSRASANFYPPLLPAGKIMKVTLERAALLKSLGHVHRVVERRNTIPILSNVLIKAESSKLFKATDLDLEIVEILAAEVGMAGSTTVPAHMLYDIVRKLPEGAQVSLEGGGDATQCWSARAGRVSPCRPCRLPTFRISPPASFRIASSSRRADLRKLIEKTQFAISTEETRYYLNGIYLHTLDVEGELRMRAVATDGHRLARVELAAAGGCRRHARRHPAAQDRRRNPEALEDGEQSVADRAVARQTALHGRAAWC